MCATVASAMDDDGPCADCFNLLQRRGPDPLKANKKDDDLWGGMERGGETEGRERRQGGGEGERQEVKRGGPGEEKYCEVVLT